MGTNVTKHISNQSALSLVLALSHNWLLNINLLCHFRRKGVVSRVKKSPTLDSSNFRKAKPKNKNVPKTEKT